MLEPQVSRLFEGSRLRPSKPRLGSTGLVSMEGMAVDDARCMLQLGDLSVPQVFGGIYTYKPALASAWRLPSLAPPSPRDPSPDRRR